MANELVRWRLAAGGDGHHETPAREADEPWDPPPTDQASDGDSGGRGAGGARRPGDPAEEAERDAAAARRRGDNAFRALREADASEQRQSRWDWGDARTW